jgi:hypothetical protein
MLTHMDFQVAVGCVLDRLNAVFDPESIRQEHMPVGLELGTSVHVRFFVGNAVVSDVQKWITFIRIFYYDADVLISKSSNGQFKSTTRFKKSAGEVVRTHSDLKKLMQGFK